MAWCLIQTWWDWPERRYRVMLIQDEDIGLRTDESNVSSNLAKILQWVRFFFFCFVSFFRKLMWEFCLFCYCKYKLYLVSVELGDGFVKSDSIFPHLNSGWDYRILPLFLFLFFCLIQVCIGLKIKPINVWYIYRSNLRSWVSL